MEKLRHIFAELKGHAPFTFVGAGLGIIFMLLFRSLSTSASQSLFEVFHPAHVVLSAMVTTSIFNMHTTKKRFLAIIAIGYFGSIGIATLSDVIIPYIGSDLMGLNIPTHSQIHHDPEEVEHQHDDHTGEGAHAEQADPLKEDEVEHREHKIHLGFIEEWYIVNPAALLGIAIAMVLPRTKFPHAFHVLISTWASMSYLLMDMQAEVTVLAAFGIAATLFAATWLPCCLSDIVFPLLFTGSDLTLTDVCACKNHAHHSHPHEHEHSDECPGEKEKE